MNGTQLNELLADEITKLRAGKSKVEISNSVARMASVMVACARVELAASRMMKKQRLPRLLTA